MKYIGGNCFAIFVLVFLIGHQQAWSQNNVGIGTREPNSNAVLQIVAPEGNQGLLIPALTTAQREATDFTSRLSTLENGLMVFDTDLGAFFYWMNDQWQIIVSGNASQFLSAGEGLEITEEGIISNIGDTDSTNDITNSTLAEGDLSGTFPELSIVPEAVTTEKIAEGAVTTGKIANNSILPQDMQSPGAGKVLVTTSAGTVFWENQSLFGITFLQEGHIYVGNSSNQPSALEIRGDGRILIGNSTSANAVNVSGDISLNSTGNTQINENAVGSAELQNLAVTTNKLADASITSAKLGDNAVESTKINDGAVTTNKIANDAIDATKLADGAIENLHVSATAAIAGTKISPDFGTQKARSAPTEVSDAANTLTTKGYVDAVNTEDLTAGDGIVTFNYDGSSTATIEVNAGAGLGFDAGGALKVDEESLVESMLADGAVSTEKIANETIIDEDIAPNAAISGTKIDPDFGNQNIVADDADFSGKVTSDATGSSDPDNTLTTKKYVEDEIAAAPSDRRLKENIQPLDNNLEKVLQLKPAQYNWKAPEKKGINYGLIAQELAEVYPHLVRKRSDGYFGVNYTELIPILIKAMQEQQQEIQKLQDERLYASEKTNTEDKLNAEVQHLKAENEQLKQEIALIKKALGLTEKALLEE